MKRIVLTVAFASAALLFSSPVRAQKGGKPPKQNFLVRAQFADDAAHGVRSDELNPFSCDGKAYDYIAGQDTCAPGVHKTASMVTIGNDTYFLAPRASTDPNPTRWLVLDFGAQNGTCPNLFQLSACEYFVTVRFFGANAFTSGATSSAVEIWIEEFPAGAPYWLTRYKLIFLNPLTRTADPSDPNIVTIGAAGDDFRADLFSVASNGKKNTRIGTFVMPFTLTTTKTDQIFEEQ